MILKGLDNQAKRIPFDEAIIVASPISTVDPKVMLDRHIFDNSVLVDYSYYKVRVPEEYEKYLNIEFGNWRDFPSIEEREKEMNRI